MVLSGTQVILSCNAEGPASDGEGRLEAGDRRMSYHRDRARGAGSGRHCPFPHGHGHYRVIRSRCEP